MKACVFILFFITSLHAAAQVSVFDSVNSKRYALLKSGTVVLGTWAASNIVGGIIGQSRSIGEQKQFFKATTIAGLVNMAFAGIGYFSARKMTGTPHSEEETFRKQANTEKLFLFSIGIDIAGIGFGLYSREKANRYTGEKRDRLKGAGNALVLQGTFLAVFDGVLYLLQAKNGSRLQVSLQNLSFHVNEQGIGLAYRL
jgi:hypothetical protein